MTLPEGVERRSFGDGEALATRGPQVGDEPTDGEWRRWSPERSKLAALLEEGVETGLSAADAVLYLGAAAGTTASHVADVVGPTYAVEFAPRPMRQLIDAACDREHLFPLLKDARRPESYAHVVEPVDLLVQDVATRGQARVALDNRQFLRRDGRLALSIKARSEDATRPAEDVFEDALATLREGYEILGTTSLAPRHDAHLGVVAEPRSD